MADAEFHEAFKIFGARRLAPPHRVCVYTLPPPRAEIPLGACGPPFCLHLADQDNDGLVSASELKMMMKRLGNELTDQEVRDIMKEAGAASSINYSQFCKLLGSGIKRSEGREDPEEDMKMAFSLFDTDRDGVITAKEMTAALAVFGVQLTDREVDQVSPSSRACSPAAPRAAKHTS